MGSVASSPPMFPDMRRRFSLLRAFLAPFGRLEGDRFRQSIISVNYLLIIEEDCFSRGHSVTLTLHSERIRKGGLNA
jgi:hypothetical protein